MLDVCGEDERGDKVYNVNEVRFCYFLEEVTQMKIYLYFFDNLMTPGRLAKYFKKEDGRKKLKINFFFCFGKDMILQCSFLA
mmetsp:Transcript_38815/g.45225  ORF Transcript_38815/g.45225 Transcript_38815/m.45225 type:complete len:82 (-) Transcript_38815:350-595(-)